MNLHEFQAKKLFADYGMPVPKNTVISQMSELDAALTEIDDKKWVIKAQVHAGGRGKAGGVEIVNNKDDAKAFVKSMLGTQLVTFQTEKKGSRLIKC